MQELTRLEPNQFDLQGDNTQLSYSTTSITGEPQFNFTYQGETRTFSGSEIRVEDTGVENGIGRIVTVMLENNEGDQGYQSLSLLLPVVQLSSESVNVPIQTIAILSQTFIRVVPGARQLQTYNVLNLSGTAELVDF
ncbi:hypothetical protein [Mastigocladopsis repens]|uniref:hypothetical protein n=1 Tax=Mastigocladopsis repens TaxID=221287 RepID=UPI00031773B5|nr:hypothetical protein [Mastigocladopsis repens]